MKQQAVAECLCGERQTDRQRERERQRERKRDRQTERQTDRQTENSNSKTVILKYSSAMSIWTCLTASKISSTILHTDIMRERVRERERETDTKTDRDR